MVAQIASRKVIHRQVEVLPILEGEVHVDQEGVVQLREDLALVHHGFHRAFGNHPRLAHLLQGVFLLVLLPLHFPHFAEPALSNAVGVVEGVFGDSCN